MTGDQDHIFQLDIMSSILSEFDPRGVMLLDVLSELMTSLSIQSLHQVLCEKRCATGAGKRIHRQQVL